VQAQVRGDGEAGEICFVFFSEGIISVSWTISIGFIYVYLKHEVSADWSFFSNFSGEWV